MFASLEELANKVHSLFIWRGSQEIEVIHLECPFILRPIYLAVSGSHKQISPFISPDASIFPFGLHEITNTQFLCPFDAVSLGSSVPTSQKRIVVSPEPLARFKPSGENYTLSTLSVCPGSELL